MSRPADASAARAHLAMRHVDPHGRAAPWLAALALLVTVTVVGGLASAQAPADPGGYVAGEKTLEGRLLAPCCWAQTLDIHESEISSQLRAEIRQRLIRGESPDSIEQDMVARYGERIRAVPAGKSLTSMGVWLSVLFGIGGVGAIVLVVRWVRRATPRERGGGDDVVASDAPERAPARDKWDERLDDELRDVDD